MRSSKSRSRSKSNRQRSIGNIVNRVFDSSGPEGKVRGTPQQIIDKYLTLARDAQLSNDRVAEQNFLQHAEHYTRMLGEATREMQREQEARQAQQGQGGGGQPQHQPQQQPHGGRDRGDDHPRGESRADAGGAADVIDVKDESESTLVETPESTRADDQPEAAPAKADRSDETGGEGDQPKPRRGRPRGPRKPRGGDGSDGSGGEASKAEPSAAE